MELTVRCDDVLPEPDTPMRCQLRAAHEGRHMSVALSVNLARHVWMWSSDRDVACRPFQADLAAGLPWAPGMPTAEAAISES